VAIQFVNQWQIGAVFVAGQFASQERTEESRAEENPAAGEKWAGGGCGGKENPAERYVCSGSIYLGPSLHFPNLRPPFWWLSTVSSFGSWQKLPPTLCRCFLFFSTIFCPFFLLLLDRRRSCSSDCISLANNSGSGWHFLHKLVNMKILH